MTTVYIISAPSGSGKSTLVNEVRPLVPGLDFSISYTTRAPRGSERNGCEYFFVTGPEFEDMIEKDEFLEHAKVHGKFYGTARRFLLEAAQKQRDLLLDIDVQGAEQIKRRVPEAVRIFILPPDLKTLEQRLRGRSSDEEEVIKARLVAATREIENYEKYDYILVNDRLEESTELLKAILQWERQQRSGRSSSVEDGSMAARAESCRLENMRQRLQPILASFQPTTASGGR